MKARAMRAAGDVIFKVATEADITKILGIRERLYVRHFGHHPEDHHDRSGQHLVAVVNDDEIVAGVRLLGPALRPFDFEHVFDLSVEAASGRQPAMLGRLFVREEYRTADRSTYLLTGLFDFTLRYAIQNRITDYYMYTFSHLLRFYRRAGFNAVGTSVYHEHWRDLHLMHLDVLAQSAKYQSIF